MRSQFNHNYYLKSERFIEVWILFILNHLGLYILVVSRSKEDINHRIWFASHQVSLLQVGALYDGQG